MKKYIVRLTPEERTTLKKLLTSGRGSGRMFTRVRILLKADQSDEGPAWSDERISNAFDVTVQTIEKVRKQLVEEGFDAVLSRRQYCQKVSRKKIDGEVEAHLVALCCSDPPKGRTRWTLRLLAGKVVELGYVDNISYEAVRQTLKKTNLNLG
jgi:transposase